MKTKSFIARRATCLVRAGFKPAPYRRTAVRLYHCLLLLLLLPCGCTKYDDNAIWDIWDRLNSQDARIAALEEWQATMNRDIVALQKIVTALQNYDYVTGVTSFDDPTPGGHQVSFARIGTITIWNGSPGADGEDGEKGDDGDPGATPQIGVAQYPDDSGVYYWTLNGDWLLDGNEDKIPVTGPKGDQGEQGDPGDDGNPGDSGSNGQPGATPKVAIGDDNFWYVCPDGTCTGTPATDGDGGWEDTGTKATGATGATGPQGDAIFAQDGIDYSNPDYVTFTLADGTTTIQVPKYRPLEIAFDQPAQFNNGETKNIDFTPTGNVQSITAVDVPRGWTVTPNTATSYITVTAPASDGKYYTAAGTVTLLVSDGAERTVTQPLALECSAYVPPAGLGIDFTQPGMFGDNETKEIGFTLTGGGATVKALNVPQAWTVKVTVVDAAGTFTITSPATMDETNIGGGEALVFVTDAAGNTVMRTLTVFGTPPHAASTQVWTFGESPLVWSDRIAIPECNKDGFSNSSSESYCRSYKVDGTLRYYYNWPYVNTNAATLCPAPWRVPTKDEFETLTDYSTLTSAWGLGGLAYGSSMVDVSSRANYWSSTDYDSYNAYNLYYNNGNLYVRILSKTTGFQVRCVK